MLAPLAAEGDGGYHATPEVGSHPYRLTTNSDPDNGAPYGQAEGVPYDNFHAYWSPNGRQVIWTHTEANPLSAGGETWSMLLGDFKVKMTLRLTSRHLDRASDTWVGIFHRVSHKFIDQQP